MANNYLVTLAVCFAAALACVAIVSSTTTTATVPAFLWSGASYFTGTNIQVLDKITDADIEASLKAILTQIDEHNALQNFNARSTQAPEIVLLFLEPKLRSDLIPLYGAAYATEHDGGAFVHLKSFVESSASSLVIPYAEFSATADLAAYITDSALATGASVIIATSEEEAGVLDANRGPTGAIVLSRNQLDGYLAAHSELFTNTKPDVIIVRFESSDEYSTLKEDDAFVGAITDAVANRLPDGRYVALYTSSTGCIDPVSAVSTSTKVVEFADLEHASFKASSKSNTNNPNAIYGTGYFIKGVWEAIVIVVVLLVILFIGICCTFCIQVPKRYEAPASTRS